MFVMIDLNVKAGHVSSTLGQCYVCSLFIEVLTTIPKDEYTAASSDIIDAKISCCLVANFYVNICLLHNFCHYYQLNIFFYYINGCFGRLFIEFQSVVSLEQITWFIGKFWKSRVWFIITLLKISCLK